MKTSLKNLVATALTAIVLSSSVFTSVAAENVKFSGMAHVNPEIKKVIVSGNVKVLLVQSNREWVSLDEDKMDKVSIKQVGHTLTLSSTEKEPVMLTVYVTDPYRIDASNNACVKTVGTFNVKHLQVMVKDNAVAYVKAKTESIYTVVNGNANLELGGSTANHIIKTDGIGKLNMENFAALKTDNMSHEIEVAMLAKPTSNSKK
jgi:hypothetical protein